MTWTGGASRATTKSTCSDWSSERNASTRRGRSNPGPNPARSIRPSGASRFRCATTCAFPSSIARSRRWTSSSFPRPSPRPPGARTGKRCCAPARSKTSPGCSRRPRGESTRTAGGRTATAWWSIPGARSSPSGPPGPAWSLPRSTRRSRRRCAAAFPRSLIGCCDARTGLEYWLGHPHIPFMRAPEQLFSTAQSFLLAPHGLETGKLAGVFGSLLSHRLDYADLYFQYSRSEGWSLEEGIVKSGSFNIEQGVGVRAVSGEKTAFAYSDEISFDALHDAAKATRAIAAAGQARVVKAGSRKLPIPLYASIDPIASLPSVDKVALLEKIERKCRARDPRVTQVMASLGGEYEVVLIARADGGLAADVRPLVRLSVQVIAEQNGRRESGTAGGGGRTGYSPFA